MYKGKHSRMAVLAERQRRRHQKKLAALASAALVGILAVGGTIAWLADGSDEVTNTFTPSEVTSEVTETFDGAKKENVSITNTGDTNAYIRATLVANWVDSKGNVLGVEPVEDVDFQVVYPSDGFKWVKGKDGYWYWPSVVEVGKSTEVLIASCVPLKDAPAAGYMLSVDVLCGAVQADGVNGQNVSAVKDAWGDVVSKVNVNKADDLLDDTLVINSWINE